MEMGRYFNKVTASFRKHRQIHLIKSSVHIIRFMGKNAASKDKYHFTVFHIIFEEIFNNIISFATILMELVMI